LIIIYFLEHEEEIFIKLLLSKANNLYQEELHFLEFKNYKEVKINFYYIISIL